MKTRPDQTWYVKVANISDAKASLSRLIQHVREGNEVILAKAGQPVAKIVPYDGPKKRVLGGRWQGATQMSEDFDTFIPPGFSEAFGLEP